MNLKDRLIKLESVCAGQTRYRVHWKDGAETTESNIFPLLALTLQPDGGGLEGIEPLHKPPYNVLEKIVMGQFATIP